MSYLRILSKEFAITLITYEKDEDWADRHRVRRAQDDCAAHGITWLPQRFRTQPRIIAPALSMARMVWLVRREALSRNVRLIHARSYIPAAAALAVRRLTGIPFIFDMRALWPEELITAARLKRGSLLHRSITWAERACLREASAVVSLTSAAVTYLKKAYPRELERQHIAVIPTCADLERFTHSPKDRSSRVIGCLGTVLSGWFKLDWLSAFLTAATSRDADLRFVMTTRDDPNEIRDRLAVADATNGRIDIAPCPSELVHDAIQGQMASVMFFTQGLSKLGSSPTRMGEVLGCGIPVVANAGVGDVEQIIRKYRVGVLVTGPSPQEMNAAWDELQDLLKEPGLAQRCRNAAEAVFSLESGADAYASLYRMILDRTTSAS